MVKWRRIWLKVVSVGMMVTALAVASGAGYKWA